MLPALRADVAAPAPVVERRVVAEPGAELDHRRLLGKRDVGIGRVAQDEPVEGWPADRARGRPRPSPRSRQRPVRDSRCRSASAPRCARGWRPAGSGTGRDDDRRSPRPAAALAKVMAIQPRLTAKRRSTRASSRRQPAGHERPGHLVGGKGRDRRPAAEHDDARPQPRARARRIDEGTPAARTGRAAAPASAPAIPAACPAPAANAAPAEPSLLPDKRSRRPSINPGLHRPAVFHLQHGAELDQLGAGGIELEGEAPAAVQRIGARRRCR